MPGSRTNGNGSSLCPRRGKQPLSSSWSTKTIHEDLPMLLTPSRREFLRPLLPGYGAGGAGFFGHRLPPPAASSIISRGEHLEAGCLRASRLEAIREFLSHTTGNTREQPAPRCNASSTGTAVLAAVVKQRLHGTGTPARRRRTITSHPARSLCTGDAMTPWHHGTTARRRRKPGFRIEKPRMINASSTPTATGPRKLAIAWTECSADVS